MLSLWKDCIRGCNGGRGVRYLLNGRFDVIFSVSIFILFLDKHGDVKEDGKKITNINIFDANLNILAKMIK